MPTNLIDHTHELLRSRDRSLTYSRIAKATGLTKPWIQDFALYKREGSSSRRLEKLKSYLERMQRLARSQSRQAAE